jgi:hypothetical protein
MLMKLWQGDFKPGVNENAAVRVTGSTEVLNEHTENMAGDSTTANGSSGMTSNDTTKKIKNDTAEKMNTDTTGKK